MGHAPPFQSRRLVRDGGILSCVRADIGEVIYRQRLRAAGQYSASQVIAKDHLYLFSNKGSLTVVRTGDEFEVVRHADLKASVVATPAIDQDSLYVRTGEASQTGKGYAAKVIAAAYKEKPEPVTLKKGQGLGSFEEEFDAALLKGRPLILCDNTRKVLN